MEQIENSTTNPLSRSYSGSPGAYDFIDDDIKGLKLSGRWSDLEAPTDFYAEDRDNQSPPTDRPVYSPMTQRSQSNSPKQEETVSNPEDFNNPKYEAPVFWIGRTFRVGEQALRAAIMKAFSDVKIEGVEIVDLYLTKSETRDHAYVVLNSADASDMLLDGKASIIVTVNSKDGDSEENRLVVEVADHIAPSTEQDPYTLYVWQLPLDRPAEQVKEELKRKIMPLAPIITIEVPSDESGNCKGSAKVVFKYEKDTQKCVYMLNYNTFLGSEIRAAFWKKDRFMKKTKPKPIKPARISPENKSISKSPSNNKTLKAKPSVEIDKEWQLSDRTRR